MAYDSTADTLKHSIRVGTLMTEPIKELTDRSVRHDLSKTEDPELAIFNEYTPKLRITTYGSDEYKAHLAAMGDALAHHYAANRHHPEHFADGINDMTLVDLIEMLADWKAATERHTDGDLRASLKIQQERFGISDQLADVLWNTAVQYGWLSPGCGSEWTAPDGTQMVCNVPVDFAGRHVDGGKHADGRFDGGVVEWS